MSVFLKKINSAYVYWYLCPKNSQIFYIEIKSIDYVFLIMKSAFTGFHNFVFDLRQQARRSEVDMAITTSRITID